MQVDDLKRAVKIVLENGETWRGKDSKSNFKAVIKISLVYKDRRMEAVFNPETHTLTSPRPEKYLDEAEASNRCALVSRNALTAASRAVVARNSTPVSSTRIVIQNKRLLSLSALVDGDRPTHPLAPVGHLWLGEGTGWAGGDLPRPLRRDSRPDRVRLHCSRTKPNIRPRCLPAVKTPSLRSAGFVFVTSRAPLGKNSLPAGHNKKSRRQKLFPGCDVTTNPWQKRD